MGISACTAFAMRPFDLLLGIVPGTTGVEHEGGQQSTHDFHGDQVGCQSPHAHDEAYNDGCDDGVVQTTEQECTSSDDPAGFLSALASAWPDCLPHAF